MIRTRILLVDDDILSRWLVTDCLNTVGYDVTGLCRGSDAIEMLEIGRQFDLLLTDIQMPDGVSGFDVAIYWRQAQPGRPILYTSTSPELALGQLQGGEGFICKHAAAPDLLNIIAELLAGSDEQCMGCKPLNHIH